MPLATMYGFHMYLVGITFAKEHEHHRLNDNVYLFYTYHPKTTITKNT